MGLTLFDKRTDCLYSGEVVYTFTDLTKSIVLLDLYRLPGSALPCSITKTCLADALCSLQANLLSRETSSFSDDKAVPEFLLPPQ